MRHDVGNTLKFQDNHEGSRALPLNPVECGISDFGGLSAELDTGGMDLLT
jgi:hypothetical protein